MEIKNPFMRDFKNRFSFLKHIKRSNRAHAKPSLPFEMRHSLSNMKDKMHRHLHNFENIDYSKIFKIAKSVMLHETSFGPSAGVIGPIGKPTHIQHDTPLNKLLLHKNKSFTLPPHITHTPFHSNKNTQPYKKVDW